MLGTTMDLSSISVWTIVHRWIGDPCHQQVPLSYLIYRRHHRLKIYRWIFHQMLPDCRLGIVLRHRPNCRKVCSKLWPQLILHVFNNGVNYLLGFSFTPINVFRSSSYMIFSTNVFAHSDSFNRGKYNTGDVQLQVSLLHESFTPLMDFRSAYVFY